MPSINDSPRINAQGTSELGLRSFPTNPLLVWAGSGRTQGSPPPYTSIFLNVSKFIVMRSGWGFQDNYCMFDVAALGAAHYHQDKLNVIINAYGRFLLYDSGGGNYEDSIYRTFSVQTGSHNTVMVDNKDQNRVPTPTDIMGFGNPATPPAKFNTTTRYDYGVGYYMDNYGPSYIALHKREVLFIKETLPCFVIVDTLTPNDTKVHNYKALWNLLTTNYTFDVTLQAVMTTDKEMPNMAILPLIKTGLTVNNYIKYQNGSTLWGWNINKIAPFYNPALESVHELNAAGIVQFATLLVPLQTNQTSPVLSVGGNSTYFIVKFTDNTLTVTLTKEGIVYSLLNTSSIAPSYSIASISGDAAVNSSQFKVKIPIV